jgi:hypothetical protein
MAGDEGAPLAQPVMRGLGNGEVLGAAGASRFGALNLTLALPGTSEPLVPRALRDSEDFSAELMGQFETASTTLENRYTANDPHYLAAVAMIAPLRERLQALKAAVPAAQATAMDACLKAVAGAERRARQAAEAQSSGAVLGLLAALLPPAAESDTSEDRLGAVQRQCSAGPTGPSASPELAGHAAAIAQAAQAMAAQLRAIDRPAAQRKAEADLGLARQVLRTLLDETDLIAVGPLLMADGLRLDRGRTRWGLGAGVRVAVVRSVELDAGFMVNLRRAAGEPRAALVLSLRVKDFF